MNNKLVGKTIVKWLFKLDNDKAVGDITVGEIEQLRDALTETVKGTPYCLGCKNTLPSWVKQRESFKCPHCGSVEYDFGIREGYAYACGKED